MVFNINELEELTKDIAYKTLGDNAEDDLSKKMILLDNYLQKQLRLFGVKSAFCDHKWIFSAPNRKQCQKCELKVLC